MPLSDVPVESFGGLNLVDDPGTVGWNGAIDCLNVDLDRHGRVRSRAGLDLFITSAAGRLGTAMTGFTETSGTRQILVNGGTSPGNPTVVAAYSSAGAFIAVSASIHSGSASFVRFGRPPSGGTAREYVYFVNGGSNGLNRWNGSAFTLNIASTPTTAGVLAVTPWDNRLVAAGFTGTTGGPSGAADTSSPSHVYFSDAGNPETWQTNNYVQLYPGDGEAIKALTTWGNQLFVFKESKFFVFYGTSTDNAGNPIFNYRTIPGTGCTGGMVANSGAVAGTDGVYFVNARGVYRTTGGAPELISRALDPIFLDYSAPAFYSGSTLNSISLDVSQISLVWHAERLFVTFGDTRLGTFVYDPTTGAWLRWQFPYAMAHGVSFASSTTTAPWLFATLADGHVYLLNPVSTTDNSTAISSSYRSGFSDLGTPDMKRVHKWRLQGSGTPTLKISTDFGSLETGVALTLGTSPAVTEAPRRYGARGRQFSWQLSGSSAWSVNNLVAEVAGKRRTGEYTTA